MYLSCCYCTLNLRSVLTGCSEVADKDEKQKILESHLVDRIPRPRPLIPQN